MRVADLGLDMIEVEDAPAREDRLDHPEVFAGHEGIAEDLADAALRRRSVSTSTMPPCRRWPLPRDMP